jgi:periplasmic protein TonB
MTNKELLHASMLDILFDGRNKNYGAYVLRRDYNKRLVLSLGLGLFIMLLFFLVKGLFKDGPATPGQLPEKNDYNIISIQLPVKTPDKTDNQPKPKIVKPDPPQPETATAQNTTIKLVDDNLIAETEVPDVRLLDSKTSGIKNTEGDINSSLMQMPPVRSTGNDNAEKSVVAEPLKPSFPPQFPGGFEALRKFLYRHLATPDQLGIEAGEKKTVIARFVVDEDGSVSVIEILESAGDRFDKEVMRVCKKMPKWKPAIQNGKPVSASYVLPVIFVSEEQ